MIQTIAKIECLIHHKHYDFTICLIHPSGSNGANGDISKWLSFIRKGVNGGGLASGLQ
jgi:hypothetical protein